MAKRKRSKREISEQARRNAENMPSVRRLRELAARGERDAEERRDARAPTTSERTAIAVTLEEIRDDLRAVRAHLERRPATD